MLSNSIILLMHSKLDPSTSKRLESVTYLVSAVNHAPTNKLVSCSQTFRGRERLVTVPFPGTSGPARLPINYLIDEAEDVGKGADATISFFHHFFQNHSLKELNASSGLLLPGTKAGL